jgi:phosphate transport system permease protein
MSEPTMDTLTSSAAATLAAQRRARMAARLTRRHAGDRLFKLAGLAAVAFSALVLVFLLVSMASSGLAGFQRSELRFDLPLRGQLSIDRDRLAQPDPASALELAGLPAMVDAAAEEPGPGRRRAAGRWRLARRGRAHRGKACLAR